MSALFPSFFSLLQHRWNTNNTLLCVGLDVDIRKMPSAFHDESQSLSKRILSFNTAIIDATAEFVCCYKPQSAFYEQYGTEGLTALCDTVSYIHANYPDIPVLLDAKRGDVGNTADAYATAIFDVIKADAVTINPYMGRDSVQPFLNRKDKGIIILAKTSNLGSGDFQDKKIGERALYEHIARTVSEEWNEHNNCGLVVGATYPEELHRVREIVADMVLLIPGIGAQGGDLEKTVTMGKSSEGSGMILSSSRAILYAASDTSFAEKAAGIAKSTRDEINRYR